MPEVEILHVRDPDGGCDITVLVDGERVQYEEVTVDPGRGHDRADWLENIEHVRANDDLTPGFRALAVAELEAASSSKYIEDF